MNRPLPYDAALADYEQQAQALFDAVRAGDEPAAWRFKWLHPAFRGRSVADVRAADLNLADAQTVLAREYGFGEWAALVAFTDLIRRDDAVRRFEAAADAVVSGDLPTLRRLLGEDPELVRARSTRAHRATLLNYVGANGTEHGRQKTPANAVEVAKDLLQAGADVNATADLYDAPCTTLFLAVSSCFPAQAGLQVALAETLLGHGASVVGPPPDRQPVVLTALAFGYRDTAEAIARRGPPSDNLAVAAGLGRIADVARLLPTADPRARHIAFALAAQHGHVDAVRLLLDAGEDPNRFNPAGYHAHSTPLHQAVWSGRIEVVRLLVDRGARTGVRDTIHQATPLGWAVHGGRTAIADHLRERGAAA